ncbi:hypothetical protein PR048_015550, partial [Dryococelus australis]
MHMRTAQVANEVHNLFYERKRTARQRSMKNDSHEVIIFDLQKNLPMPNLTTNDVCNRRQLSLYSFKIHTLSTGPVFYCYPETEGRKSSDEVTAFLHCFIFNLLDPEVKDIEHFYDGCARQNRNYIVLRFLHYVVHAARRLVPIKLTFPVRSQSYVECDRNMALIKHKYPAELPEHWVECSHEAMSLPVSVNEALLISWTQNLTSLYTKTWPIATWPLTEVVFSVQHPRFIKHRSTYNGTWETAVMVSQKSLLTQIKELQLHSGEFLLLEKRYQ